MGWIEVMQTSRQVKKDRILNDMQSDVQRLRQVSHRFSQIGSKPVLKSTEVIPVIRNVIAYIRRRAPQLGRPVTITENLDSVPPLPLSDDIFQWALENIMKNALDAMDKNTGVIAVHLGYDAEHEIIFIDVEDNGRGISEKDMKRVFKPGYSTKKRGWGLGLSLAKRIIEEYHNGKLYVKESRVGEGTVMRVELPFHS